MHMEVVLAVVGWTVKSKPEPFIILRRLLLQKLIAHFNHMFYQLKVCIQVLAARRNNFLLVLLEMVVVQAIYVLKVFETLSFAEVGPQVIYVFDVTERNALQVLLGFWVTYIIIKLNYPY